MAFDYSSRDYSTIKSDLLARAGRVVPEWTDRDPADFGMLLVDLWAQMGDVLHYYVDRAAGESLLSTATQRESVVSFANLFDYDPNARTSARATVNLQNTSNVSVTIPRYTKFIARYDGRTYQAYAYGDTTLAPGVTGTVFLREGSIVVNPAETLTNNSSGRSGQTYSLTNRGVVNESVEVFVYEDGVTPVPYRYVSRLSNALSGDRVFTLRSTPEGRTQVVFGTDTRGFVPPSNTVITAVYAYSSGSLGNLPANSVTAFRETTPEGVNILSSSAFVGGENEESIESLKRTIPSLISTQNRAVTIVDFINLAQSLENVSKATASYSTSASATAVSVTVFPQENRASDYLTTTDVSQTVSQTVKDSVARLIAPKALLGVTVLCADTIEWVPVDIAVTVYASSLVSAANVKKDVEDAIDNLFSFDRVSFGQTLSLGRTYRSILNNFGVDYATITLFDLASADPQGVQNSIDIPSNKLPKKGTVAVTVSGGIAGS